LKRALQIIGVVGLVVFAFLIYSVLRSSLQIDEAPLTGAQVSKSARLLIIENASPKQWKDCRVTVEADKTYTSQAFDLAAGREFEIPLRNFIARDGLRFNPWAYLAKRVLIECGSADYRQIAVFEFRLLRS
jgi:hypothetical protein